MFTNQINVRIKLTPVFITNQINIRIKNVRVLASITKKMLGFTVSTFKV